MPSVHRTRVALALAVASLALPATATAAPATADPTPAADVAAPPAVLAELEDDAADGGSVPVLVTVAAGVDDPSAAITAELAGTDAELRPVADGVVAVDADAEALDRLARADVVEELGADPILHLTATTSASATGADIGHSSGHTGAGRAIAVVDTGVDGTHPALTGALAAEACFVGGLNGRCPNGRTTQVGAGAGSPCVSNRPACGHGTHVAGIAAGRPVGSLPGGIAPAARLVSIRIFDADPNAPREVAARTSDLIAALDHVRQLRATLPIDAVNLSISGDALHEGSCDGPSVTDVAVRTVAQAVNDLRALGVATVVATGNGGNPQRISFPACLSGAVRVAATTAADGVASFANRSGLVSLAAPGIDVLAATPGGRAEARSGTSMAAPQISGAIAVLNQRYDPPDVSWVVARLEATGRAVADSASGRSLRRLDLAAAAGLRPTHDGVPVPAAGAWVITDTGRAVPVGAAPQPSGRAPLARGEQVVAAAPTRSGLGYWMASDRGRVTGFGDAAVVGDASRLKLNRPITAMAATTSGAGYWLLGADGGVLSFGDARFHGSTGDLRLNAPVTDLAASPSGGGYWLTARDGGVFSFGDARFAGSTGGMRLNQPVVSIAAGPTSGYWLVALDGGVFAFDTAYLGSLPGSGGLPAGATGHRIRSSAAGTGYHILTTDGTVRAFGRATAFGRAPLAAGERAADLVVLP